VLSEHNALNVRKLNIFLTIESGSYDLRSETVWRGPYSGARFTDVTADQSPALQRLVADLIERWRQEIAQQLRSVFSDAVFS